ncbi:MAG: maleylpyruvate isomerase family mycothiol-dependent enzyme [Streptosporangiaceae bacterium]
MDIGAHIRALDEDGRLLATAAEEAGLRALVPSCPDWQVRDLLRHTGHVHRWATRFVAESLREAVPEPAEAAILAAGPPDGELLGWFRAGHAGLVRALTDADPDLTCWTFLPAPSPRAFWARRQAHETAIHRVDAELAAGGAVTPAAAEFGADGIDELVMGFFGRDGRKPPAEQRGSRRQRVLVQATDTGGEWLLELTEDGRLAATGRRADGTADCTLAGPAAGLYLLLWNRAEPAAAAVTVTGAEAVLRSWREGMRVTWQ